MLLLQDVGFTRDNVKEAWGRCCSLPYGICFESRVTAIQCRLTSLGIFRVHQLTIAGILPVIRRKSSTYNKMLLNLQMSKY